MGLSKRFILSTIIIAAAYLLFTTYLRNLALVNSTLIDGTALSYKMRLFTALLEGLATTMTTLGLFTMIVTGLLIGVNLTLVAQKAMVLKRTGRVHFVAGGSSLLGIVGGGCASCGLPVISLLGLSGSILYLPFKGAELPYVSIVLLLFSLFFLLKTDKKAQVCKIDNKQQFVTTKKVAKAYTTVKERE